MEQIGSGTLTEIRKEAAAWLIEMDADPEHWDRHAFVSWLKSSPRHMEEFLEYSQLWVWLHDTSLKGTDTDEDLRQALGESANVVEWPQAAPKQEESPSVSKRRWWWFSSLAAILLVSVSAIVWSLLYDNVTVLTTGVGEQRAVRLADNSVVHLNTDSQVEIRFSKSARDLRLIRGEAMFKVERDVERPFRVRTDSIQVEALGTQFNVRRRASDTIVSVVEGRIAVVRPADAPILVPEIEPSAFPLPSVAIESASNSRPTEKKKHTVTEASGATPTLPYEAGQPAPAGAVAVVGAGEQVRVSVNGTMEQEAIQNVMATTAWRQRQLIFTNTPLADIAAEVARYNATPKLQIEGDALQTRELSGVFAADDPESLIQFLERDADLSVIRSGDTVIIRSR